MRSENAERLSHSPDGVAPAIDRLEEGHRLAAMPNLQLAEGYFVLRLHVPRPTWTREPADRILVAAARVR